MISFTTNLSKKTFQGVDYDLKSYVVIRKYFIAGEKRLGGLNCFWRTIKKIELIRVNFLAGFLHYSNYKIFLYGIY